jgi:hypothetical protein
MTQSFHHTKHQSAAERTTRRFLRLFTTVFILSLAPFAAKAQTVDISSSDNGEVFNAFLCSCNNFYNFAVLNFKYHGTLS